MLARFFVFKFQVNRIHVTCFQSVNQSPEGEPPQWGHVTTNESRLVLSLYFYSVRYTRIDVPLQLVRSESIRAANLQCLIKLPELLNLEETQLYQETLTPNSDGDLLTKVHNASGETFAVFSYPKNIHVLTIISIFATVYSKATCHILQTCSGPLINSLQARLGENKREIERLQREKQQLLQQLQQQQQQQQTTPKTTSVWPKRGHILITASLRISCFFLQVFKFLNNWRICSYAVHSILEGLFNKGNVTLFE